jgi:hypothetical protein
LSPSAIYVISELEVLSKKGGITEKNKPEEVAKRNLFANMNPKTLFPLLILLKPSIETDGEEIKHKS